MDLINIITESAQEVDDLFDLSYQEHSMDTVLFGSGGIFDSLDLVKFIVTVEDKIFKEYGKRIELVTDKAMSQKRSPFYSVSTILKYIEELIKNG